MSYENFKIFKKLFCGFGCVPGAPSPFFENFRKLWKFLNTFHIFSVFIRQLFLDIFDVEFCSKLLKNGEGKGEDENGRKIKDFSEEISKKCAVCHQIMLMALFFSCEGKHDSKEYLGQL